MCRSGSFRPSYARLNEIRAFVPSGVPMVALTATVTKTVRDDVISKLEMCGCQLVSLSPNRDNIYYDVVRRSTIESDLEEIVESLRVQLNKADRVIVYCRSRNMCADLYEHFHNSLGDSSYYPSGAPHLSVNRLFGMFHAQTAEHIKEHILTSMSKPDGTVRVVFATVALGMGVNFAGLNLILHYGAPSSIDDYFQESGRSGRSGDQAKSIIYWKPVDVPLKQDLSNPHDAEIAIVRRYLENETECRRYQLMRYFDPDIARSLCSRDSLVCCNVCAKLSIDPTVG